MGCQVYHNIMELVGNTPLLELENIEKREKTKGKLFAKLEYFNPGGSVKDRIALNMIEGYEKRNQLRPGGTIIEATSGNTGIGLAAIAAAKGYRTIIVMPESMSKERISILKGYGAEVVLTSASEYMPGAQRVAREYAARIENSIYVGQSENPDNPAMHERTTGPEIWEALDGKVDAFVAAVGTGGTLTGTGRYLRSRNPEVRIAAVEPDASPVLSGGEHGAHKIQGIGPVAPPEVLDTNLYNEVIRVTDADAYEMAAVCARAEGMSIGISAGANLWAAIQIAKREAFRDRNIVLVFPDKGERYLSSGIYDFDDKTE